VSVALDTRGARAYIHGMAITPNGRDDGMSIHWHKYGRGTGEHRASHAGATWRIVKVGAGMWAVERAMQDRWTDIPTKWESMGTYTKLSHAKCAVQAVVA
jgi:hypothetical protein